MNAIRIRRTLDSDTVHLPELKPLIGKAVEIIVLEETPADSAPAAKDWSALEAIAGKDLIDPELHERCGGRLFKHDGRGGGVVPPAYSP